MADLERFVDHFVEQLRRAGLSDEIKRDGNAMTLVIGSRQVHLDNAWADFCREPFWRRGRVVRQYVAGICESAKQIPNTFDEARDRLLVQVRDRSYYGLMTMHGALSSPGVK